MDPLRNYARFQDDTVTGFKSLIDEFNFNLTNPFEGCYLLKGEKCIIKLTYDRGDVFGSFLKTNDSPYDQGYNIFMVYNILYESEGYRVSETRENFAPKDQIISMAKFIENNLSNVLGGDFSWEMAFNHDETQESKFSFYVLDKLDSRNPIYIKFWKGDNSWKSDLNKYLHENNINL